MTTFSGAHASFTPSGCFIGRGARGDAEYVADVIRRMLQRSSLLSEDGAYSAVQVDGRGNTFQVWMPRLQRYWWPQSGRIAEELTKVYEEFKECLSS